MDKKALNWEQLINDGENYGGMEDLSPHEKIVFESIKDNKLLKIQDNFLFSKKGKVEDNHGINLATLIAGFKPLKDVTTLIITHNQLGAEGLQIIVNSKIISKIEYLHLGSNGLGDEGAKIVANAEMFSEVHTLNLECNGIKEEGAIALANSPYLTKLTSLNMVDNRAGDAGALAIANSDTLSNLTYLHLGGNRVKSEEVKKALRESSKLTHLKTLKVF